MVTKTWADFLEQQKAASPSPLTRADLTGKVVVVIGANTGIGLEVAKHFAEMRAEKVIIGCRSEEKGLRAVESGSSFYIYHARLAHRGSGFRLRFLDTDVRFHY
jgi:NAD(P)-dependent dehydrogenase (short-subunit alcohol dehydrogenase family)